MIESTMPVGQRWVFGAIWLAFLIRGAFYCQLIPLWEGYDEWGHYAFLEHVRLHPGQLPSATDLVTAEIHDSVLAGPEHIRHEAFEPLHVYEAQQPPLYYWILSVPNRVWSGQPISTRVHRLRLLSVLIASLAIPFGYLAAFELFRRRALALSVCALISAMPGLIIYVARVGNDTLAVALASCLAMLLLRRKSFALGIVFGLGLLTKAYFLAFVPLLILRRRFTALAVSIAISGWWYLRNFHLTGTLSGEIMDVQASRLGWTAKLAAASHLNWFTVIDAGLWTHIWTGAWSFLTIRSWMYRIFEIVFAILAIALLIALIRRPWGRFKNKLATLTLLEMLFAAGIAYQALSIFMSKSLMFGPGWYFYALVVNQALLFTSGILILVGRRHIFLAMACLTGLYAALDLYTVNVVLARYYAEPLGGLLWILYVIATLTLVRLSAAW